MQLSDNVDGKQETRLLFKDCSLKRLSSYSVITPEYLKRQILQEFFSRLYFIKKAGGNINITFEIEVPHKNKKHIIGPHKAIISGEDIPAMNSISVNIDRIAMFESSSLDYAIIKTEDTSSTFLMTALCVDNRTQNLEDIVSMENLPSCGYKIIFILNSSFVFDLQILLKDNHACTRIIRDIIDRKITINYFLSEKSSIITPLVEYASQRTTTFLRQ